MLTIITVDENDNEDFNETVDCTTIFLPLKHCAK